MCPFVTQSSLGVSVVDLTWATAWLSDSQGGAQLPVASEAM